MSLRRGIIRAAVPVLGMVTAMLMSVAGLGAQQQELPGARRELPWEKLNGNVGQALYRDNCVVCHDITKEQSTKIGPSFYRVFQRDKMPRSNTAPSRDYFSVLIRFGRPPMPSFRDELTPGELNQLIDYIEQTTLEQ